VYKDAELEALLDEDSCQTQKELALGVSSKILYLSIIFFSSPSSH